MLRFGLWMLLFTVSVVTSQFSACGGPASSRFAIEFCKKGFTCKPQITALPGGKTLFEETFGIADQPFCESLWNTRVLDPLDAGKASCKALDADLNTCLTTIETLDCVQTKDALETKCNFCKEET